MENGLVRQSLELLLSIGKIFLKVALTVLSIYFLSVVIQKEDISEDRTSSMPLFSKQFPSFYFSLCPSWYDGRLCTIGPSQLKRTGVTLMRNGLNFEQWKNVQDQITQLSRIGGKESLESLRYIDNIELLKKDVSALKNDPDFKVREIVNAIYSNLDIHTHGIRDWFPLFHNWGMNNSFQTAIVSAFEGEKLSVFKPALRLSFILSIFAFIFSAIGGTGIALLYMNLTPKLKKILHFKLQFLYIFPVFCLAILAVQFFTSSYYSPWLNWFPGPGSFLMLSSDLSFFELLFSQSIYLILPAVIIAIPLSAGIALRWIGGMDSELGNAYILTLKSKGLSNWNIYAKHVIRNVSIPMVIYFSLLFPALISGIVLIENIFAIGGLGRLTFQCVLNRDLSSLLIIVGFIAMINIIFNKLGIFFSKIIDPRLKISS